jgi:hypothetical protein
MTRAGKAGIPGERRARKIEGQFIPRLVAMMESPAYRVLSLAARRCLDRIEIELAHHGGLDNGQLAVTYAHFVEYGVDRHAVRPALRQLEALGFIEITEHGTAGNAAERAPNKFRLTYRPVGRVRPTHEWRRITSTLEATMDAETARESARRERRKYRVTKIFPSVGLRHVSVGHAPTETEKNSPKTQPAPVGYAPTTSILSGGSAETSSTALPALPTPAGPKSTRARRRKLPWSTPTLTEITDPAAIEAIRRNAARALADPKCAKCQPDPIIVTIGSKRVVTRDLSTLPRLRVVGERG